MSMAIDKMFVVILLFTATSVLGQDLEAILQGMGVTVPPGGFQAVMADPAMVEMVKQQADAMGYGNELAKAQEAVKNGETVESLAKGAMDQANPEQVAELAAKVKTEAESKNITIPKDLDQAAIKSKVEDALKQTIPPNIMQAAEKVAVKVNPTLKPVKKAATKKSSKAKKAEKSSKGKTAKKTDNKSKANKKTA